MDIVARTSYFLQSAGMPADVSDAQVWYDELITIVAHHNRLYQDHCPIITDGEYDQLFKLLQDSESRQNFPISPLSMTHRVGGSVRSGFESATHTKALLSLPNSYNADDLLRRHTSINKTLSKLTSQEVEYIIEPKFDGISVELIYDEGVFVQAITRGDGTTGEDITTNVRTIASVPLQLTQAVSLHIRGEIVMPKSVFHQINHERISIGEAPFANPRNACGGTLRQLDSSVVARRKLIFIPYEIL